MPKNKKGQVTIFVILGILIVAALATVFVLRDEIFKTQFEREASKIKVADEFLPIKTYLDNCLEEVALDGALLVGQQAGYLNVPEDPLPVNALLPFSNSLDVFNNGFLKIPYWFYETANGIQKQQIPNLKEIEGDLSTYIKDNANTCLNNFTAFEGYDVSGFVDIGSGVDIADNKIFIKVLTPVNIKFKDLEQEIENFYITLDVPLGSLYNTAVDLFNKENEEFFFEEKTIDMMVLYDEIPFSKTEFSCDVKIWHEDDVKNKFKEIVSNNINAVKLKNSNFVGGEKYFILDVNGENINADFKYSEEWPFFMEVFPNENGILKGEDIITKEGASKFLSNLFCLNNYHFVYDVKYPVLVTLSKDNYNFQFSFQVILDNNQPRENLLGGESLTEPSIDVCSNKISRTTVYALAINEDNSLTQLEDADVSFKCFSTTCPIGKTSKDEFNEFYLSTEFPQCLNGLITAEKDGYYKGEALVTTNQEQTVSLFLEPIYNINFDITIIDKNTGQFRNLKDNEQIILQLVNDNGYSTTKIYPGDINIELIPGNYDAKIYLVVKSDKGIKIEKEEIRKCVKVPRSGILGLFLEEEKCVDITLEEAVLNELVSGGVQFRWNVNRKELASAENILFYVIAQEPPKTHEDVNEVYDNIIGNSLNQYFKEPEFEK